MVASGHESAHAPRDPPGRRCPHPDHHPAPNRGLAGPGQGRARPRRGPRQCAVRRAAYSGMAFVVMRIKGGCTDCRHTHEGKGDLPIICGHEVLDDTMGRMETGNCGGRAKRKRDQKLEPRRFDQGNQQSANHEGCSGSNHANCNSSGQSSIGVISSDAGRRAGEGEQGEAGNCVKQPAHCCDGSKHHDDRESDPGGVFVRSVRTDRLHHPGTPIRPS